MNDTCYIFLNIYFNKYIYSIEFCLEAFFGGILFSKGKTEEETVERLRDWLAKAQEMELNEKQKWLYYCDLLQDLVGDDKDYDILIN